MVVSRLVTDARRFDRAVELYARDIAQAIAAGDIPQGEDAAAIAHRLFTSTIGISTVALYNPALYNKALLLAQVEGLIERICSSL